MLSTLLEKVLFGIVVFWAAIIGFFLFGWIALVVLAVCLLPVILVIGIPLIIVGIPVSIVCYLLYLAGKGIIGLF